MFCCGIIPSNQLIKIAMAMNLVMILLIDLKHHQNYHTQRQEAVKKAYKTFTMDTEFPA